MSRQHKRLTTKHARARDDSRAFEKFMAAHNEEVARREAEEARAGAEANEEFAEGYLAKMRRALGLEGNGHEE